MKKPVPAWTWSAIARSSLAVVGFLDWVTGYELHFFVFYFLPVSIGAWSFGLNASLALSVLSAIVWYGVDFLSGHEYPSPFIAVWNTAVRLVSFIVVGWCVSKIRELLNREHETREALHRSLSEIKLLESFLPICAECRKIRDQQGQWQQMESYIGEYSNTQLSHGLCPDCYKKALKEPGLTGEKTTVP